MTRKKKINSKKEKNPFLNAKGGLDLIEKFPGTDYMPYEKKQIKKSKKKG